MNRFRSFAAGLTACLLLSGCSSVYLHDEGLQTSTADLKTKFDKLSAPAFFDAQEKNLIDLSAREDRALANLLVTSRNSRLLNAISPTAHSTSASQLKAFVEDDLEASYGVRALSAPQLGAVTTAPFRVQTANENIEFMREAVGDFAAAYKKDGGTQNTDCQTVLANPFADATKQAYNGLFSACTTLFGAEALVKDCTLGASKGMLRTLCLEGAKIRDTAAAKDRMTQLKRAEKALVEAMKARPSPLEENVNRANALIQQAKALPDDERLKTILSHVETLLGEELEDTISRMVAKADATAGAAAPSIETALQLLGAASNVTTASETPAAEYASALLIGLATVRHDINLLDLDIATGKLDAEIVDREAGALRRQIYYLAQAQIALASQAQNPARAEAEAMTFYVRSLDTGRHPYELLTFRRSQLLRSAALKRARTTEEDYRRLIQPAIDQIAAYGAGGIKPETIADILSGLPVAGSILAE